jgi:hypothetical protein
MHVTAIFTACESTQQHICITFCFKTRKTARETYELLQQAYGEDAMGCTQAFDWFHRFKDGGTSFESDPRSALLADSEGVVHHKYTPEGQIINKEFYLEILRLRESVG